MNTTHERQKELPLLLRNLKKVFADNIQGPILLRDREYQATTKSPFLFDLAKFLSIRGVDKLAAIHAWKSNNEYKLAYHFIARIGRKMFDTKITIVTFLSKNNNSIKSIKKIYSNSQIYEEEIKEKYSIEFKEN